MLMKTTLELHALWGKEGGGGVRIHSPQRRCFCCHCRAAGRRKWDQWWPSAHERDSNKPARPQTVHSSRVPDAGACKIPCSDMSAWTCAFSHGSIHQSMAQPNAKFASIVMSSKKATKEWWCYICITTVPARQLQNPSSLGRRVVMRTENCQNSTHDCGWRRLQ